MVFTPLKRENCNIYDKSHFRISHRPSVHPYGNNLGSFTSTSTPSRSSNDITDADEYTDSKLQVAKNVFMFGSNENGNSGFSFKMGNFFRGVGNSVKNMFGFK